MRSQHRHPDELGPVRPRREAAADVTERGDVAVRCFDVHAQQRRVLHEVLPVPPLFRAALFHPVLLAVAFDHELVAVGVRELARAVARRETATKTKDISDGHASTMRGHRADGQCRPRNGTPWRGRTYCGRMLEGWGSFVHRRRWAVLGVSLALLAVSGVLLAQGGDLNNPDTIPSTESGRASQ